MKYRILLLLLTGLFTGSQIGHAGNLDPDLGKFLYSKQQQIGVIAESITNKVPALVWRYYDAVRADDWESASNLAVRLNLASRRYLMTTNEESISPALMTKLWSPIMESIGVYEQFHHWNNRWLHRFGREIIGSIPPGSIYFGGTDPGRFLVSAMCESQVEGKPFFVLTQNQLADQTYLDYLRMTYGRKIHLPTEGDAQKAFTDYVADAERRRKLGLLKPGEQVTQAANGQVQISGQVAVMEINGLLVKDIFKANPDRSFFVEESFPLDWMYPHLTPHGIIFQLHREPVADFTAVLAKDNDFWKGLVAEMLGKWLDEKTSVQEVCDFAGKYGLGKHLEDFKGDKEFAANEYARKAYSKLRSSIAGLYAWRAEQARDAETRMKLYQAADLAFRQAYAICPYSPEALFRYINLLSSHQRTDDALLLVKTSLRLDPGNETLKSVLKQMTKSP